MSAGTFAPAPGRAPMRTVIGKQIRMELLLTARRGEAVVLAMGVPLLVLLGAGLTHVTNLPTDDRLGFVVPGVLALTVMSTAFTGQAITTGYERSYGVLKRLGASPLTRPGLLLAKTAAVLVQIVLQVLFLGLVGVLVGWRPELSQLLPAAGVTVLAAAGYSGLALLLASVLKPETTTGAATLIYVLMLSVGGIMFAAPDLGAAGWFLLPLAAHAQALRDTLLDGGSIPLSIWLALATWAVVWPAAAARSFRWE
ncbi:ABC-2 type transport system permease protein [Actinoplanes octamycinicus]|uniref:ABC-2 type transport system permease protein n=1 Tax=Actinoplanes octamycinicus TaxID=135948 RepID=A0A7W7GQU0_9ACTN|nr:ABC transporter permease [Actinoplanes octamycinicus]MBB4736618.1 ABC-2 type transport system permease protein [Actinoplanes octamycinicus]GIE63176.1 transport permease protein [Actinoplanes octamycinicus]